MEVNDPFTSITLEVNDALPPILWEVHDPFTSITLEVNDLF